jgi:outer membrane protein TolC
MQQAAAARDFATRRFAAEQRKYELGVTQMFFVLDAQTQLNEAESESLSESIAWQRSLLNLHVVTGDLLAERGVTLADWPGDAHHPDPGAIWPESARGAAPVGTRR